MTTFLVAALLAVSNAPAVGHRSCPKTFTLSMAHRGADVIFHQHGPVTDRERRELRRLVRCQRRDRDRPRARAYVNRQRRARNERRREAARRRAFLNPPVELSSLARCIMWAETGDRFYIAVGEYEGVAMWNPDAWRIDGGYRYASTPLGATPLQQEAVLMWALDHGMAWEWTADPCV